MTVNHRGIEIETDAIEIAAELRHLGGVVFVSGNDFVDRIEDHCLESIILKASDQKRRQSVHRHGSAAKIPHLDVGYVLRPQVIGVV